MRAMVRFFITLGLTALASAAAPQQAWLREQVKGNLDAMMRMLAADPAAVNGRDLPNGALAALVLAVPASAASGQVPMDPSSAACRTASDLLRRSGAAEGMSFGGQSTPSLLRSYSSCFNATEAAWVAEMVNRSLPASQAAATPQEVSYTNMWLMSTVDAITWGELPGTGARGAAAADIGYGMLDRWLRYSRGSGTHEFTSPTYTYVQLSALYTGYIHARRPGYRAAIGRALDTIWAETAANTYRGHGALSGPHSRDYDTLLGHGQLLMEMYLWGLPSPGR